MFKTLKWIYDLGVRQERVRIARYLENEAANLHAEYGVEHNMISEMPHGAKQRKQRLELKHATTERVQEIVNMILKPQYPEAFAASIMFPDDEHKGVYKK